MAIKGKYFIMNSLSDSERIIVLDEIEREFWVKITKIGAEANSKY
jgi:hypothetical protein